ncbi:MAG: bifunctional folylpolyglutamate synthase/dihydrofolate synthase [Oligosphaeraceae bacterium]
MRDFNQQQEDDFFARFKDYFDLEKSVNAQHNPENYTLDRMLPLLEAAGHPERRLKFVHVAGTKGKGSTCHFIAALINAAGHSVGLFTSPHLSTVRERFELNGQLASYEQLDQAADKLLPQLRARNLTPSLFEIFTVLALQLFADEHLDYAVMETGIGGSLDATNIIPTADCCAITPISFDHTALLGNTIPLIAAQKAGIIKPNVPVVVAHQPFPDALPVIAQRAQTLHAPLLPPLDDDACTPFLQAVASRRDLPTPTASHSPNDDAPAWPPFLRDNFAVALAVVRQLGLSPAPDAFIMPQLRARCETIHRDPLVILDAAHNADSMAHLVAALKTLHPDVRFTVILASVQGKDIAGIVRELVPLHADVILTNPHTPRASALPQLQDEAARQGLHVIGVIPDLHSRSQLPPDRPLLFTGSFFCAVIGEALFN